MGHNRRNFIQKMLVQTGATFVASNLFSQQGNFLFDGQENSWEKVINQFPISKDKFYFNNGTMGPSPTVVIEALIDKINLVDHSGHYGDNELSRKKIANFIGADENEISLTHNTTEGINIICWGLKLKKGDHILISNHEHVGGALPWLNLAKLKNLKVDVFTLGKNAEETIDQLKKKVNSKTKVIAIPHITCTFGQVQPIKEISAWAKTKNISVVVDGAHGLGLFPLDMKTLGIDYYASCCHKWLCAPKGTGFLYINKKVIDTITPQFVGAGSDSGWNTNLPIGPSMTGYAPNGHRFYYGTQNTALWQGVNAAITFFEQIGIQEIYQRSQYLSQYFMEHLSENKNYNIISPTSKNEYVGMVCFKHKEKNYAEVNTILNKDKIRVRVLPEHGLDAIRTSFHLYNSESQIDFLIKKLEEIH